MPGILFTPEDGGDISLQNCRLPKIYIVLQPRRQYASAAVVFRIVERSMSSEIAEVNGIILGLKILFKAVLEMILQRDKLTYSQGIFYNIRDQKLLE
jgi:hypothetical protein